MGSSSKVVKQDKTGAEKDHRNNVPHALLARRDLELPQLLDLLLVDLEAVDRQFRLANDDADFLVAPATDFRGSGDVLALFFVRLRQDLLCSLRRRLDNLSDVLLRNRRDTRSLGLVQRGQQRRVINLRILALGLVNVDRLALLLVRAGRTIDVVRHQLLREVGRIRVALAVRMEGRLAEVGRER